MNKRTADRITAVVMIAIAGAFLFERRLRYPANVFPNIAIVLLVSCSLIIFIRTFTKGVNTEGTEKSEEKKDGPSKKVLFLMIGSFIYLGVMNFLGFYVASFIFLVILAYLLQDLSTPKKKRLLGSLLMSIIMIVLVFLLFRIFLKVPTPQGFLI